MPGRDEDVVRVGRAGVGWRVVLTVAALVLVANGSLRGNDSLWPFAPMSQFAFRVGNVDVVKATRIDALTTDGTVVKVPLNTGGVGISRAEIEGNLERIKADPALMASVAEGHARLHPDQAAYTRLWLRQKIIQLDHGVPGASRDVTLAEWEVPR